MTDDDDDEIVPPGMPAVDGEVVLPPESTPTQIGEAIAKAIHDQMEEANTLDLTDYTFIVGLSKRQGVDAATLKERIPHLSLFGCKRLLAGRYMIDAYGFLHDRN